MIGSSIYIALGILNIYAITQIVFGVLLRKRVHEESPSVKKYLIGAIFLLGVMQIFLMLSIVRPIYQLTNATYEKPIKTYVCPKTKTIDCMPIVDESRKDECDPAYLRWVQTYCPGVTITQ